MFSEPAKAEICFIQAENIRRIDPKIAAEVSQKIVNQGAILLMRHGEQTPPPGSLPPAALKIAMMRAPENRAAPATDASLAEFLSTVSVLASFDREISVEGSSNLRARQPAEWLAELIQKPLELRPLWDCVDYLPESSFPNLLQLLPEGTLPWKETLVDAAVGPGTYRTILDAVSREILPPPHPRLRVIITHTQQIQAACQLLGLPLARLGHYGFILILPHEALVYPNGFYEAK